MAVGKTLSPCHKYSILSGPRPWPPAPFSSLSLPEAVIREACSLLETMGDDFGTLGSPWRTTGEAGRTRGGLESDRCWFWVNFRIRSKTLWVMKFHISRLFPAVFLQIFESNPRRSGISKRGYHIGQGIGKNKFPQKSFFVIPQSFLFCAWGGVSGGLEGCFFNFVA